MYAAAGCINKDSASGTLPELAQMPILFSSMASAGALDRTCRINACRSSAGSRFAYVIATIPDAAINRPHEIDDCMSRKLQPTVLSNPASGYPATMITAGVRAFVAPGG